MASSAFRAIVLCAALLMPGLARAAHPDVEAAKTAYRNGDFAETLARLAAAEHSPAATEDDRIAINWYRAASFHAQGRTDEASAAIDELLKLRPLYQPERSETPPNLRALFKSRQDAYEERHGVWLADPVLDGAELRVPLSGHIEEVSSVRAFVRASGQSNFNAYDLSVDGAAATGKLADAELWEELAADGTLDLVVEAYGPRGALVARYGDALQPTRRPIDVTVAQKLAEQLKPQPVEPVHAPVSPSTTGPRRNGFTPWMMMGALSFAAFACCGGTCASGIGFLVTSIATAIITHGSPLFVPLLTLSSLSCSASCVSLGLSLLLGTCTATLWAAELYYVGSLPFGSSAPVQDTLENPAADAD